MTQNITKNNFIVNTDELEDFKELVKSFNPELYEDILYNSNDYSNIDSLENLQHYIESRDVSVNRSEVSGSLSNISSQDLENLYISQHGMMYTNINVLMNGLIRRINNKILWYIEINQSDSIKNTVKVPMIILYNTVYSYNMFQLGIENIDLNKTVTSSIIRMMVSNKDNSFVGRGVGRQNTIKFKFDNKKIMFIKNLQFDEPMHTMPLDWLFQNGDGIKGGYLNSGKASDYIILKQLSKGTKIYTTTSFREYMDKINRIQKECSYIVNLNSDRIKLISDNNILDRFCENRKFYNFEANIVGESLQSIVDREISEEINEYTYKKWCDIQLGYDYNNNGFRNLSDEKKRSMYRGSKSKLITILKERDVDYRFKEMNKNVILGKNHIIHSFLNYIYRNDILIRTRYKYDVIKLCWRFRLYIIGQNNILQSKIFRLIAVLYDCDERCKLNKWSKKYIIRLKHPKFDDWNTKGINNRFDELLKEEKDDNDDYRYIYYKECARANIPVTFYLDAVASMLQVISIIFNIPKLMEWTNIGVEPGVRNDPYIKLIELIKKERSSEIDDLPYKNLISNRKFVKTVIMESVYGSTPLFTCRRLVKNDYSYYGCNISELTKAASIILQSFNRTFPQVSMGTKFLRSYYKHILDKENSITLRNYSGDSVTYIKNKVERGAISINIGGNRRVRLHPKLPTNTIDRNGCLKGFLANTIHILDSNLLVNTRINLLNRDIKTFGIHDSIGVSSSDIHQAITEYNKELHKLHRRNFIKDILSVSGKDLDVMRNIGHNKIIDHILSSKNISKSKFLLSNTTLSE